MSPSMIFTATGGHSMYELHVYLPTFTVCNFTFEDTLRKASMYCAPGNLVLDNANKLQVHIDEAAS